MSGPKVRVAILDDHQSVVDGYYYRLGQLPEIEVVGPVAFGEVLETLLAHGAADVIILDVSGPTSRENNNPYPVLHVLPKLLERYPSLVVLVISMLHERTLIKSLVDAGASGYIFKEDRASIQDLGSVVLSVASGGIYFSQRAHKLLLKYAPKAGEPVLTPRQLEALSLSAAYPGEALATLTSQLHICQSTRRNLLHNAYTSLGVRNCTEAILKARELGLVTPLPPTGPD